MGQEKVIEISGLTHSYGKNKVLHGIDFSVEKGKTFGLLGKNGAGKTTTINIMMGFLKPDGGKCLVFGEDAHRLSPKVKRKIGLLHEGHLSYEFMSIDDTEKFYRSFYPAWDAGIYALLMKKLGLKRTHKIKNMSCGQRSQVALAVLMAQNAEILILDDFSMGLDAGYRRLFIEHLNFYVKEREKPFL
jgi:ABC-2 type transport system ATP-binding protein